jgi:lipopolysaccharide export system protein LptA
MLRSLMLNKPHKHNRCTTYQLLAFISAVLVALVFPSTASAINTDSDKPIHIEAGKLVIKEKQGISYYTGHVKITQGTRIISGDSITIHAKDSEISKIIIKGSPASFSQKNEQNETTRASANQMVFYVKKDLLVMTKNAVFLQKDNVFKSEKISYNTATDVMMAGDKDALADERVKMTIHPKKDSQTTK